MKRVARLTAIVSSTLLLSSLVRAAPVTTVEDALKDVKQAGGMCRPDNYVPPGAVSGSTTNATTKPLPADHTCVVDISALNDLIKKKDVALVDTRSSNEFEQYHIDGAWNLSAAEVKLKSHLSKRSVVLIGNGKGEAELYRHCAQLQALGFTRVGVLRGGMPTWIAAKSPIVGREPDIVGLLGLSPGEFFFETANTHNRILLTPEVGALKKDILDALVLKDGRATTVATATKSLRESKDVNLKVAAFVIASHKQPSRDEQLQMLTALRPHPVLFYFDGITPYKNFLTTQYAVWEAQARGPKLPPCSQ